MRRDPPSSQFSGNIAFVEYERLLVRLQELRVHGLADSADAHNLLESMDALCDSLSGEEITRLNGISADLYMTSNEEMYESAPLGFDEQKRMDATNAGFNRQDWAKVLAVLRMGVPSVPSHRVAFIRARCYMELGHNSTALHLVDYAVREHEASHEYRALSVMVQTQSGEIDDAVNRAQQLFETVGVPPDERLLYPFTLLLRARKESGDSATNTFAQAASLLERVNAQMRGRANLATSIRVQALTLYGFALEKTGRASDALKQYDMAIALDPNTEGALVFRGTLRFTQGDVRAYEDFSRAVTVRSSSIIAYLCLASFCIDRNEFAAAADVCKRGLGVVTHQRGRALLLHFYAISRFEAFGLAHEALQDMHQAMKFDPENELIRSNFQVLQGRIQQLTAPPMDWERITSDEFGSIIRGTVTPELSHLPISEAAIGEPVYA